MPDRAAIVTGASRGIGFALAEALGEEGYGLTVSARKPDTLVQAAEKLRAKGYEVEDVAANMADEDAIREVVARHGDRFGRLDVLVNNAGVGIGAAAGDHQTKFVDMQLDVNLRAIVLFYRECADMLRAAGSEHSNALVVNMASIGGQVTAAVAVGLRGDQGRRRRLHVRDEQGAQLRGRQVRRVLPGLRRHRHDRVHQGHGPPEEMLRTSDITAALRFLLHVSPACVVPEIIFQRPGEAI